MQIVHAANLPRFECEDYLSKGDKRRKSVTGGRPYGIRGVLIRACALIFCGFLAAGAASAQVPDGCNPLPPVPPNDFSAPPNLDLIKRGVLYYRCTRYEADIAAVLHEAKEWVAQRAPQVTQPAIVLDIDETSLSNWTQIYRDQFAYSADGPVPSRSTRFLRRPAMATQRGGAGDQARARSCTNSPRCSWMSAPPCRPVDVFFVTGRQESGEPVDGETPTQSTMENLNKVGYLGLSPDHLYMRRKGFPGPVENFKTAARTEIEQKFNVTIIANVGDQDSDLVGGRAERAFKVPSPLLISSRQGWSSFSGRSPLPAAGSRNRGRRC